MIIAGLATAVRAIPGTSLRGDLPDAHARATRRALSWRPVLRGLGLIAAVIAMTASGVTVFAPAAFAADDPAVDFTTSTTTGPAPLVVDFAATANGEPTSWAWDFGDGGSAATPAASHSYGSAGTFTVALTVTFADRPPVVATKRGLIVVTAPPAVLAAGIGLVGFGVVVGRAATFVDASTGSPASWAWDFGDGGSSTDAGPTYTYVAVGTFVVTLKVRKDGAESTATRTIRVLAVWAGVLQLYQKGSYSAQRTYLWCTPASTQMIRNMVTGTRDHSVRSQRMYYVYGRANNGFRTPNKDGVDPAGWEAVLRRWVDPGYHIVSAGSYASAVRAAARAMRLTGRPVAVFVGHGSHAWVLSGFTSTADPATAATFTVTSVNVEGPLHPRPTVRGFDPAPNVRLSGARFRYFLTPYRDKYEPLGWRNRYVVIVP